MTQKVALITGAAAGIGRRARSGGAQGIAIGVLDLDAQRCAGTVAAITAPPRAAKAIASGRRHSKRDHVKAAVATLREALRPGHHRRQQRGPTAFTPSRTSPRTVGFHLAVNVRAPVFVTQEVLPT